MDYIGGPNIIIRVLNCSGVEGRDWGITVKQHGGRTPSVVLLALKTEEEP